MSVKTGILVLKTVLVSPARCLRLMLRSCLTGEVTTAMLGLTGLTGEVMWSQPSAFRRGKGWRELARMASAFRRGKAMHKGRDPSETLRPGSRLPSGRKPINSSRWSELIGFTHKAGSADGVTRLTSLNLINLLYLKYSPIA